MQFDSPKELSHIEVGCLSDVKSWIFYPKAINFEVSLDGTSWTRLERKEIQPLSQEEAVGGHFKRIEVPTNTTVPVYKVRIVAENFGKCPDWHLGAGNDTWMFLDEITYR